MTPIPKHLIPTLEATTGLNFTDGNGRNVKREKCPHCGARILTGLDGNVGAILVHADPTPLSNAQELACTLTGRPTFFLDRRGKGAALERRQHWHIGPHPAAKNTIVPAHLCGARFPDPPPKTYITDPDAPPPF